jgi:hypothetical protein
MFLQRLFGAFFKFCLASRLMKSIGALVLGGDHALVGRRQGRTGGVSGRGPCHRAGCRSDRGRPILLQRPALRGDRMPAARGSTPLAHEARRPDPLRRVVYRSSWQGCCPRRVRSSLNANRVEFYQSTSPTERPRADGRCSQSTLRVISIPVPVPQESLRWPRGIAELTVRRPGPSGSQNGRLAPRPDQPACNQRRRA